jgi:hypothetical protein
MTRKRRKIIAVNKIFVIFAHVGHWLKAIAVNVRGRQDRAWHAGADRI